MITTLQREIAVMTRKLVPLLAVVFLVLQAHPIISWDVVAGSQRVLGSGSRLRLRAFLGYNIATGTEVRVSAFEPPGPAASGSKSRAAVPYGTFPLWFEKNNGQTDAQVHFVARG